MAKDLNIKQKKELAHMLYIKTDLSQKEIAEKVGIVEKTMSIWVREGNWQAMKRSLLTSKGEILRKLYDLLEKIGNKLEEEDSIGDSKIADMYSKYTAAIKNLETETSVSVIIEVAKIFLDWLMTIDPKFALSVGEHLDTFIKERLKKF